MSRGSKDERPWVAVNMAMTADGKIATAGREVTTFGSPRDLRSLYSLRATADAVLCGARTVEETGATLGNGGEAFGRRRIRAGLKATPLRVVVSGRASLDPSAAIWTRRDSPIVVLVGGNASAEAIQRLESMADAVWKSPAPGLDLKAALAWLRSEWGIRRLVCEGGGSLNASMFQLGLVDELRVTLCPLVFGGVSSPTVADGLPGTLDEPFQLGPPEVRVHGNERFLIWKAHPSNPSSHRARPSAPLPRGGKPPTS